MDKKLIILQVPGSLEKKVMSKFQGDLLYLIFQFATWQHKSQFWIIITDQPHLADVNHYVLLFLAKMSPGSCNEVGSPHSVEHPVGLETF